ncbi:MAG: ATP-dependent DNA helicase RecG [Bacilli bacterium]|jgi:ATP-dependent DNA helicase RecG|nr:ATP-dependent DNA helicase RecG [Bacilli bacterium]
MDIFDKLSDLKITNKQKDVLDKLNLITVDDLLTNYPNKYQIIEENLDVNNLCVEAIIKTSPTISFYNGRHNRISFKALIKDKEVKIVIFNRYYLFKNIKNNLNNYIVIKGKYQNNNIIATELFFNKLEDIKGIKALYSLRGLYNNKNYHNLISKIYNQYQDSINNYLPIIYQDKYQFMNIKDAIKEIHFASDKDKLTLARYSLIYSEFFMFCIEVLLNRKGNSSIKYQKKIDINKVQLFVNKIKYDLTNDQKKVVNEIYLDLISDKLMNRILIADVGSGKTLIGLLTAYMVINNNYQVAFMAPTTILAAQHYQSALELFEDTNINVALLTRNISLNDKLNLLNDLKNNKINLLIGTHALYQDDVVFNNLGLVIFDEQQKFGVNQRLKLLEKGSEIESLMLSATPIPRTLAQIIFANIDVSYMHQLLPFKKPIITYYFKSNSIKPYYYEMIKLLNMNQQIYIVAPLVEESENLDIKNVIKLHQNITKYFNNKYQVGLLHGKLSSSDKEQVMNDFNDHKYDILVATSLLEVGISVDNATCIIIYDAERFGLSQLHQLRGRVGRKDLQGYCVLLSNSEDENVIDKLKFLKDNNDGFKIAEYDLLKRGSGDILGTRQTGLPNFKIANLSKNKKILEYAFKDAQEFIENKDFDSWYQNNKDLFNKEDD